MAGKNNVSSKEKYNTGSHVGISRKVVQSV